MKTNIDSKKWVFFSLAIQRSKIIFLSFLFISLAVSAASAGGGSYQSSFRYKALTGAIVATLAVKLTADVVRTGVSLVPGYGKAAAVSGAIESVVTIGVLYSLGHKKEAGVESLKLGISHAAGEIAKAAGSPAPIGSAVSVSITVIELNEEFNNLIGSR